MIEQGAKLGSEDIDLWIASETAIQARYDSEAILSDKDLGYINRFRLEAARNAAISSRVLLRVALASATGTSSAPETWEFDRTELEKPFVERGPKFHFSISHAGPLIAITISQAYPVGVDIEPAPPRTSLEGMQHYLHANERRATRYLPRGFKESAFLRFWTLKEAFAKSTGAGMNLDFAGIDFSSAKDGRAWVNRVTGQQCVLYTSKFQRLGLRANGWLSFAITTPDEILIINLKLHKLERHGDMLQEEQRVLRIKQVKLPPGSSE